MKLQIFNLFKPIILAISSNLPQCMLEKSHNSSQNSTPRKGVKHREACSCYWELDWQKLKSWTLHINRWLHLWLLTKHHYIKHSAFKDHEMINIILSSDLKFIHQSKIEVKYHTAITEPRYSFSEYLQRLFFFNSSHKCFYKLMGKKNKRKN